MKIVLIILDNILYDLIVEWELKSSSHRLNNILEYLFSIHLCTIYYITRILLIKFKYNYKLKIFISVTVNSNKKLPLIKI